VIGAGLTVTTANDRDIVLTRAFAAAPELVFAAWTTPELLMRWYGARGWNLVECTVDLRIGGAWRFVSAGPDGARMGQSGVYRRIEAPHRLTYTERFDDQSYPGDSLVDHEFSGADGGTRLVTTVRYATPEGRDRVLAYPMARGLGEGFARLDILLARTGRAFPPKNGDES
jgi:uncharacterized protein YndB with AHSA1/START domain